MANASAAETKGLGGIIGLFPSTDDKIEQRYYSNPAQWKTDAYLNQFFKPRELKGLNQDYSALWNANNPAALANAGYYTGIAKDILGDKSTYLTDYERIRGGDFNALADVFGDVVDYGLGSMKARLAAGGYGNSGPSSYDRILNTSLVAGNLGPRVDTIFNNLGRSAGMSYGSKVDQNRYMMNLINQDPLTGYLDRATAGRVYNPYMTRQGMVANDLGQIANIAQMTQANTSGFETIPGLASRFNNMEQGLNNTTNDLISSYSSFMGAGMGGMGGSGGGGMMGMLGGMGSGGGQANPQAASYNPYQNVAWNSGGAMQSPSWYSAPSSYGGTYGQVGVGYGQPLVDPQLQNFYNRIGLN